MQIVSHPVGRARRRRCLGATSGRLRRLVAGVASLLVIASGVTALSPRLGAAEVLLDQRVEVLSMRTREAKHFLNPDGTMTGVFQNHMHYRDDAGLWQEVDLTLRPILDGYVADRNDVIVKVTDAGVSANDRHTGVGVRWHTPERPVVAGTRATFSDQGLDWTYETSDTGIKLSAPVALARGPRTYSFSYELIGGSPLTVDPQGNLQGSGFTVPRAFALSADHRQVFPAGPWQLLDGNRVVFDFDDSVVPADAFPYQLDPTSNFTSAGGGDEGYVDYHWSSYPPPGPANVYTSNWTHTVERSYWGNYTVANTLIRWNTSSIPDDSHWSGTGFPQVTIYATQVNNVNSRKLTAEWYSAWPIDSNDYSTTAFTSAHAGTSLNSFSANATNWISIDNYTGASRTGYTGLRFHVTGSTPTGNNLLQFNSGKNSSGKPVLSLTYIPNAAPFSPTASDSPDPVTVGSPVTFSVGWIEPDAGDLVKAVICTTNSISSSATCPGGTWASGTYSAVSPSVASYTPTVASAVGTQNYYAFACDDSNLCSPSVAGTFTVRPRVDSVDDSPDPALAGGTTTFSVSYTSGSSVKAAICKTNAVNSDATCPGGAWATGSLYASSNPATASYATTTADAGTRTYYAFVCTAAGNCSTGTTGTFTVLNWVSPATEVVFITPVAQGPVGSETTLTFKALKFDGTPFVGPVRFGVGPASGGSPAQTQTVNLTAGDNGEGQIPVTITNATQTVVAYADRPTEGMSNVREDTEVPGAAVAIGDEPPPVTTSTIGITTTSVALPPTTLIPPTTEPDG